MREIPLTHHEKEFRDLVAQELMDSRPNGCALLVAGCSNGWYGYVMAQLPEFPDPDILQQMAFNMNETVRQMHFRHCSIRHDHLGAAVIGIFGPGQIKDHVKAADNLMEDLVKRLIP